MLSHQGVAGFENDGEVYPSSRNWGWDVRFQKPMSGPESLSAYGIRMQSYQLLLQDYVCLYICLHIPHHNDQRLISETASKPPIKCFLF